MSTPEKKEEPENSDDRLSVIMEQLSVLNRVISEVVDRQKNYDKDLSDLNTKMESKPNDIKDGGIGQDGVKKEKGPVSKLEKEFKGFVFAENKLLATPETAALPDFASEEFGNQITQRYISIKDVHSKTVLPAVINLGDTALQTKPELKRVSTLVRKAGGFTSVALKVLKTICEKDEVTDKELQDLYVVLIAQYKMLQSEQSLCVVESQGVSKECVNMYKFMAKASTSFMTNQETIAFEKATRLAVASTAAQKKPHDSRRGGNYRGRGNYRGNNYNSNNSYGGRGGFQRGHYQGYGPSNQGDRYAAAVDQSPKQP
jgi:hypothetical protein